MRPQFANTYAAQWARSSDLNYGLVGKYRRGRFSFPNRGADRLRDLRLGAFLVRHCCLADGRSKICAEGKRTTWLASAAIFPCGLLRDQPARRQKGSPANFQSQNDLGLKPKSNAVMLV